MATIMLANHKGEVPALILLLPFIAGIIAGLNAAVDWSWMAMSLAATVALFITLHLVYLRFKLYNHKWFGSLLIYAALFCCGWMLTIQHTEITKPTHFSRIPADYLLVTINTEPKVKGDVVRFTADVKQAIKAKQATSVTGTLLLTIKDPLAVNLFYGEQLLVPANFAPVDSPLNPGEFNYRGYLADRNVYHQQFLFGRQYRITGMDKSNPLIAGALRLQQNLVKKLKVNMTDTTAVAVASTLILGYRADLSDDVVQAYLKTGTIHILSVSGGHVAIIYLMLAWLLGFMNGSAKGRVVKAIIIIALIWAYAMLTGFSPAANRAALMITMVIGGKTYARHVNSLNILAASAFALLVYDPFLLLDVGFQLSYLAVAGLIVFQPIIYGWLKISNKIGDYFWNATSVSLAAQVITFPLSAFYFHQFPVYFLLSNMLIVVPITIIMATGLLLLLLPQIAGISSALGLVLQHTILLMNKALAYIEHAPFASINKIWLSPLEQWMLYILIICTFYFAFNPKRKNLIYVCLGCLLIFVGSIGIKKHRADSTTSVTFLSLRSHTGIVFKHGPEGVVFTDLSDTSKAFRYSVQPCLDSMRIYHYKVIPPLQTIKTKYLIKAGALVQFADKKLFMLNQHHQIQSIPAQWQPEVIYISNNAPVGIPPNKNQLIIADGTNSNKYLETLKIKYNNCRVLKRNKSITLASKW